MQEDNLDRVMNDLLLTLSSDEEKRVQAETNLARWECAPGFAASLFQLIISPQINLDVRQCGSIYFKHLVYRTWVGADKLPPNSPIVFPPEMRTAIRKNIVTAIICCPPLVRAQLGIAFGSIIGCDFPHDWPDLIAQLVGCLNSQDPNSIFGSLYCLLKVAKKYEYVNPDTPKREEHNKIVEYTFPILLKLFEYLSTQNSMECLKMEVLLVKIFFASVQFSMPPMLANHEIAFPWIKLLMNLLERPVPSPVENDEKWTPWVAKRWVTGTLTRLFSRYGQKRTKGLPENIAFGELFINSYAVPLLDSFFNLLTKPISRIWPKRVTTACLNFVSNSIYPSLCWKVFKQHLPILFEQILFPTLVFSQEDAEEFDEDPEGWVREQFSFEAELYNPCNATIGLISDTIKLRGEENLLVFMIHVSKVLNNYLNAPAEQKNIGEKDACLHLLGSMASILIESEQFKDGLEEMVITYILPELQSPFAFLRARALWCFGHFAKVDYKNLDIFLKASEIVLQSMADQNIAVRVFAGLALKHFARSPHVKPKLQPLVPQIIQAYLKLMTEIQSDDLIAALQNIIRTFQKEIIEIAPVIFCTLADSYLMLIQKYDQDPDSLEGSAAHQSLRTIISLLDGVRTAPKIFTQLDAPLVRLLMTFNDNVIDFFSEYIAIAALVTYYGESISNDMWMVFERLCESILHVGDDFLEECLGPLDNFISKGTEQFLSNPKYLQLVYTIYERSLIGENASENIGGDGCQLMEIVFLYCKKYPGSIDAMIPNTILLALKKLHEAETTSLQILLVGVVANGLFYNPEIVLNLLMEHNAIDGLFTKWFQLLDQKFRRLHDLKLSILALSTLFYIPFHNWPGSLQREVKVIYDAIVKTIKKYEERKLNREQESDETSDEDDDGDSADDEQDEEEPTAVNHDDNDINSSDDEKSSQDEIGLPLTDEERRALQLMKSGRYEDNDNVDTNKEAAALLKRLDEEYSDASDSSDFDLEDDDDFETLIDDIDEVLFFLEAFSVFSKRDEQIYIQLMNALTDEEKMRFQELTIDAGQRQKSQAKMPKK